MNHYVDAHCHLDLYPSPLAVTTATETQGIYAIAMTNSPSVFEHTFQLVHRLKFVRAAVGLHPQLAAERSSELDLVWPCMEKTRYVGEIGLDYTDTSEENRRIQRRVFGEIVEKSSRYGDKVLSIHSRRAATDVISALGERYRGTVILHWFSGSKNELLKAVSCGMYFSVNHQMITGRKGRDLIVTMPSDRVLTESDGPFGKVAGKVAEPSMMPVVVAQLASIWRLSPEQARDRVFANFRAAIQPKTGTGQDGMAKST